MRSRWWQAIWFLAVLAAAPAAAAATFTGSMSGTWWNPQRGGEGQLINFESDGGRNVVFFAWFTYDDQRRASWLVGNADFAPDAPSLTIPVLRGSGAEFGATFAPADVAVAPAGTVTLEYVSCARMRMRYVGTVSFEVELTRTIGPLDGDASCAPPAAKLANATGPGFTGSMSGTWWNARRGGEGQLINFESVGGRSVVFLAYFTYDAQRRATWLVGNTDFPAGARSIAIPLLRGAGARFGPEFASADVVFAPAGTAILEHVTCGRMRLRYSGDVAFGLDLTRTIGPHIGDASCPAQPPAGAELDQELRALIVRAELTGDPTTGRVIPGIDAPMAQLGKLLFFSKALSANLDVACATCHHPRFGGADALALSVGAGAVATNVVGPGRRRPDNAILVGRNANTFFNSALFDSGLFWDSRIESLGKPARQNGAGGGIRTPDSAFGVADPKAGPNLPAAQARFPVVGAAEMRGAGFPGMSDDAVRNHVAARLGDYGSGTGLLPPGRWLDRFRSAFGPGDAAALITFDNIVRAIAEYERSAVFVESPWARYVRGQLDAIGDDAKRGALVFYRKVDEGGAACVQCHKGDFFSDERHHVVSFPQVGPGTGDGAGDDFGRERVSANGGDRYRQRAPSLLNVELTAPYGHAGAYATLETVFSHYVVPEFIVRDFLDGRAWCLLPPFSSMSGCMGTIAVVRTNTNAALDRMQALRLSDPTDSMPVVDDVAVPTEVIPDVTAFLNSLTDPCLKDRACYARWIPTPDEAPDAHQLNATDAGGNPL